MLTTPEFSDAVDRGCPLVLGGPLPHVMAAKAVAFTEALRPEFADYAQKIVDNARALAEAFVRQGLSVLTGGTDNHLMVVDVAKTHGITGRQAEEAVRRCGITLNRNPIPFDPNGAVVHQRPAVRHRRPSPHLAWARPRWTRSPRSSRWCSRTSSRGPPSRAPATRRSSPSTTPIRDQAHGRVNALLASYPVYPEIDLAFLQESLGMENTVISTPRAVSRPCYDDSDLQGFQLCRRT